MADEISFDDVPILKKKDDKNEISFDDIPKTKITVHPDDHGLSERQKLSLVAKALNPINPAGGYGQAQSEIANEAWRLMGSGLSDIMHPGQGYQGAEPYYIGKGIAKTGLGA